MGVQPFLVRGHNHMEIPINGTSNLLNYCMWQPGAQIGHLLVQQQVNPPIVEACLHDKFVCSTSQGQASAMEEATCCYTL